MTRTAVAAPALPPRPLRVIELEQQVSELMGYVTLWNDVRPIVNAARAFMGEPSQVGWDYASQGDPGPALTSAIARYESLYPEHVR